MKTLYINEPPEEAPCWYCHGMCKKNDETIGYSDPPKDRVVYKCFNHKPLEIFCRCVKHHLTEVPNWFFNTIRITMKDLRLDHNFYAGPVVNLQKFMPQKPMCWGAHWKTIDNLPSSFLFESNINQIKSYLNLYKVWS